MFRKILPHITMILSAMIALFLILDMYNPLMEFMGSSMTKGLLAILCICAFSSAILVWKANRKHASHTKQHRMPPQ